MGDYVLIIFRSYQYYESWVTAVALKKVMIVVRIL